MASAVACLVLLAGCSGGNGAAPDEAGERAGGPAATTDPGDTTPPSTTTPPDPSFDDQRWAPVPIGGGGFVTGLAPSDTGEVYVRTDVGGAYRLGDDRRSWEQLLVAGAVPSPTADDYPVESIATSPTDGRVVYLAGGRGEGGRVLASDDGGRSFVASERTFVIRGNGSGRLLGERLAVDPTDPDVVLYGTRADGLQASTDGGRTWAELGDLPPARDGDGQPVGVTFVAFDPDGSALWAGVAGRAVFRSGDDGRTWQRRYPLGPGETVRDAVTTGDGSLLVATEDDVVRLRPDGDPRSITPADDREWAEVVVSPVDPDLLIVAEDAVRDGTLWRSVDGGASWDALDVTVVVPAGHWMEGADIGERMSTGALAFDPVDPTALWFAEGVGVWRADDVSGEAVTFAEVSDGIEELVTSDAVVTGDGTLLTAVWDRAVFVHPEGAAPGGVAPAGPARHPLTSRFNSAWDLATTPADPSFVAAVVDDHRNCCRGDGLSGQSGFSTDGGVTWQMFGSLRGDTHPERLRFGNLAVSSGDADVLVWLPSEYAPPHFSHDGGQVWQEADYDGAPAHERYFLDRRVLTADPLDPDTFYLLSSDGVHRSVDAGRSWTRMDSTGTPPGWARRFNATMVALPGRTGDLLLSVGEVDAKAFGLYRSTDGGDNWEQVPGIDDVATFGLGAETDRGEPVLYAAAGGASELWRSDDLGDTWHHVTDAPGGRYDRITVVTPDPADPDRVYLGFSGTSFLAGQLR